MEPLKKYDTEILQSGLFKDLKPIASPLWADGQNVYPTDRGLKPIPGATSLWDFSQPITGLAQASVAGITRAYVGLQTEAWYYIPSTAIQIGTSFASSNRLRAETWGTWALFNNGLERPRLWKNTGVAVAMPSTPFFTAQHMKRFKVHMLAANTSNDPNNLEWCSKDDIETWTPLPENTAGNITIRDLDGPILGMFNMGQNISLYANETLVTVSYLGNAFVIGALPTVRGIGVWGGEAACDLEGTNFGFGPQGIFKTDGGSFNFLDDDRVRKYVRENFDESRREEAQCWHNEVLKMIEYSYYDLGGTSRRIAYDYKRNTFWEFTKKLTRAIERQMFAYAVGSIDAKLVSVNTGTSWAGDPIAGYVQSKPEDFGLPNRAKMVSHVFAEGDVSGLSLLVEAMENQETPNYTAFDAVMAADNWFAAEAMYFRFRLYFSTALVPFEISGLLFNGKATGYK